VNVHLNRPTFSRDDHNTNISIYRSSKPEKRSVQIDGQNLLPLYDAILFSGSPLISAIISISDGEETGSTYLAVSQKICEIAMPAKSEQTHPPYIARSCRA
jgi:hypothetical protein